MKELILAIRQTENSIKPNVGCLYVLCYKDLEKLELTLVKKKKKEEGKEKKRKKKLELRMSSGSNWQPFMKWNLSWVFKNEKNLS